jgi:hypothetical protein
MGLDDEDGFCVSSVQGFQTFPYLPLPVDTDITGFFVFSKITGSRRVFTINEPTSVDELASPTIF